MLVDNSISEDEVENKSSDITIDSDSNDYNDINNGDIDQPEEQDLDATSSDSDSDSITGVEENNTESSSDSDSETNNTNNDDSIITAEDLTPTVTTTRSGRISIPTNINDARNYAPVDRHYLRYLNYINDEDDDIQRIYQFEDLSMLSYKQAMKRSDASKWVIATDKEMNSLLEQKVGTVVDPSTIPSGIKPLTCRWLYKIKYNDKNEPIQIGRAHV